MAETPPAAGVKRARSESTTDGQPHKKRRVLRRLQHAQRRPEYIEPASQDPIFVQGQLLRSISAALTLAGFDSVKPTALEMFRGCVEEYMLQFLHYARTSMATNRRTTPTAQDFASALALVPNTSTASLLKPQLSLRIPESVSNPSIAEPDPPSPPAPDFSTLLEPLVTQDVPSYIPKHFPQLPPQHAWKHTPVFPEREQDARKMRERATEEGILAEQALRKLAAAAKAGEIKAERRKSSTLSGAGRKMAVRQKTRVRDGGDGDGEAMFGEMMREVGAGAEEEEELQVDSAFDGTADLRAEGVDVAMPEGVVVNWDMNGWRRGGKKGLRI